MGSENDMSLKKAFTDAFTFSPRTSVKYRMYKMREPTTENMMTPANRSTRNTSSERATKINRMM